MTKQQTDKQEKLEAHQREFAKRFAAWWNRGADKARKNRVTLAASDTAKRDAA